MKAGATRHSIAPQSGMKMQRVLSFFLSPKFLAILIGVVVLYAIAPFLITLAGGVLMNLFGCEMVRILTITCPNQMMAEILPYMVFMYWLAPFTLPTGLPVAGVLAIIFVLRLVMLERRH